MVKSRRSKASAIDFNTYSTVIERDNHSCIICSINFNLHCHHYIPRSQGGLGIPNNLVMLCNCCHNAIHTGNKTINLKKYVHNYLKHQYGEFNIEDLKYNKYKKEC